ncbi:MAG: acyl-CoA thioesterase [Alphaproteobacteria bacterium]|nr:acyl-CoA thioesterase [Alphaproteobacteria bacterium]
MARSDFAFSHPFRVRYAEIDGQGVAFNAHYLTWFDTAITEYMRRIGWDYVNQVKTAGTDFHTVRSVVDYKAPIRFDEDIEVHVRVARIGRSSMSFLFEIHPLGREELRASGEIVWVNTDQASRKSAPVPAEMIRRVETVDGARLQRP